MSVITVGDFDGVHLGHRTLLRAVTRRARELRTESVVLTFERNTKTVLHGRVGYLSDAQERKKLLLEEGVDRVECVSFSSEFRNLSATEFLCYLRDYYGCTDLFGGSDFRFGRGREGLLEDGASRCGILQHVVALKTDLVKISSSSIRDALSEGLIERANTWLGSPYSLSGTVAEGKHLGHTIGFPTVNLYPTEEKFLPRNGVYVTRTVIDGHSFASMTNVGFCPTVESDLGRSVETHLLDATGEYYGKEICVSFLSRLREERRFSDLGALMRQLYADRDAAYEYFRGLNRF